MKFGKSLRPFLTSSSPAQTNIRLLSRDSSTIKLPRIITTKRSSLQKIMPNNQVSNSASEKELLKFKSEASLNLYQKRFGKQSAQKLAKSFKRIQKSSNAFYERRKMNENAEIEITSFGNICSPKKTDCSEVLLQKVKSDLDTSFEEWNQKQEAVTVMYMKKCSKLNHQKLLLQLNRIPKF